MPGMRNACPHRLPTGDQMMVPFATDPGWYRAYWYEPQTAQPGRRGLGGLASFVLSIITMAMQLPASVGAGPCQSIGE
jgi:hypothetical protein